MKSFRHATHLSAILSCTWLGWCGYVCLVLLIGWDGVPLASSDCPPQAFTCFGKTKLIAWCLRQPSRGIPTEPRISGITGHEHFSLYPNPTFKKPWATHFSGKINKYYSHRVSFIRIEGVKYQWFTYQWKICSREVCCTCLQWNYHCIISNWVFLIFWHAKDVECGFQPACLVVGGCIQLLVGKRIRY